MSRIHVFHHNDADGRLSAAIVHRRYEIGNEVLFYEMGYETKPDFSQIGKDDCVYVVDFSFKDDVFDELRKIGCMIFWIDHHKSVAQSRHMDLPGLRQFVDKGPSGCLLTWKLLFNEAAPLAVELISDYDSWAMMKAPSCIEFHEATKADQELMDPRKWAKFLSSTIGDEMVVQYIVDGRAMIRYRDGYCANLRKLYGHRVSLWDPRWYVGGLTGLCDTTVTLAGVETPASCCACSYALNVQNFGSLAFGDEIKNYPFVIAYVHNGKEFVVSLYSTDSSIDCSAIAKAFGGGGHKGAAGFRCQELPWQVSRYTTRVVDIEQERAIAELNKEDGRAEA